MRSKHLHVPESAWETVAIGLVLIATGAILLGGDYLGVLSLDNVRNLWPVALITAGLVDLKAAGDRRG
jgi:LiaI-LiaF-like transmembrane region